MIMEQIAEAETKEKPSRVEAEVAAYEREVEEDYRTNLY